MSNNNRHSMSAMQDPGLRAEVERIEKTAEKVAEVLGKSNITYRQVDEVFSEVRDLLKVTF